MLEMPDHQWLMLAYLMLVTVDVCGMITVEVEVKTVFVATVTEAVLVASGTLMKLEQKGVAFCSLRRLTMMFTSLQKFGGAAQTAGMRAGRRLATVRRILARKCEDVGM